MRIRRATWQTHRETKREREAIKKRKYSKAIDRNTEAKKSVEHIERNQNPNEL